MKAPFNTYKSRGKIIPKSPIIANTEEVRNYLKNHYKFEYANSSYMIHEDNSWLLVGISASHIGNIYIHFSTHTDIDIDRYDPSMTKDFTDFESFKKYLNWAYKLPSRIVNGKFDKK